jgi:hypothetical protein
MKNALCLFVLLAQLAGARALAAEDTAYTALRAIGKQNGKDALNHVVEVRGRAGAPSPEVWKITLDDSTARGGVREFEVQHGRIIADRSPLGHLLSPPMSFTNLNLDSDGVFTIANEEATKAGIAFDHADYALKAGAHNAPPVWTVDLFDGRNGRVATFGIAADNGALVHRDLVAAGVPLPPGARNPVSHETPPLDTAPPRPRNPVYHDAPPPDAAPPGPVDPAVPAIRGFFEHVKRKFEHHFEKRGHQFENFFSGKGWTTNPSDRDDEVGSDRDFRQDEKSDHTFEKDFDRD